MDSILANPVYSSWTTNIAGKTKYPEPSVIPGNWNTDGHAVQPALGLGSKGHPCWNICRVRFSYPGWDSGWDHHFVFVHMVWLDVICPKGPQGDRKNMVPQELHAFEKVSHLGGQTPCCGFGQGVRWSWIWSLIKWGILQRPLLHSVPRTRVIQNGCSRMFHICVYEPCIKLQQSFCMVNEISISLTIARSNVSDNLFWQLCTLNHFWASDLGNPFLTPKKGLQVTFYDWEKLVQTEIDKSYADKRGRFHWKKYPNFKSPGHCLRSLAARSRASTLRSESNPMGRSDSEAVRNGNILACRCFILLLLASCKGCWWLMEQPSTSTMEFMPCFQHLMALVSVRKMVLSLADYGSPTLKRTNLYSSNLFQPERPIHFFAREVWSRMLNTNQQICNFVGYKVLDKKNFPFNVWNAHSRDLFANIGPKMR